MTVTTPLACFEHSPPPKTRGRAHFLLLLLKLLLSYFLPNPYLLLHHDPPPELEHGIRSTISQPYNFVHRLHVEEDLTWKDLSGKEALSNLQLVEKLGEGCAANPQLSSYASSTGSFQRELKLFLSNVFALQVLRRGIQSACGDRSNSCGQGTTARAAAAAPGGKAL